MRIACAFINPMLPVVDKAHVLAMNRSISAHAKHGDAFHYPAVPLIQSCLNSPCPNPVFLDSMLEELRPGDIRKGAGLFANTPTA